LKPLNLFSNAVRAKEVVTTLARFGFADLLQQLETPPAWLARIVPAESELNTWQRARAVCEELGPTFVKFGQLLSTRADVLPNPLISELKNLRKRVRAEAFETMLEVIEEGLESSLDDTFSTFDRDPVAAGSLGQVYRARLRSNGREVAVKIQRPEIRRDINADLEIAGWLAKQAHQRIDRLKPFDLPSLVEEAGRNLIRELDFKNEARNATIFNANNPYPETVFAPGVLNEYTTPRVIVTDWVDGVSPDELVADGEERRIIAFHGGRSVFHQILIAGFFHADPHGGNISITSDRRICFLDWGLAGHLTRRMRYNLADLLVAIVAHDSEHIVRVAMRMAPTRGRFNQNQLEREVSFVLGRYQQAADGNPEIGRLVLELIYLFGSNGIAIARDYTLLAKAVLAIEEAGRELDPEFDIAQIAKPFLERITWERWNPLKVAKQTGWALLSGISRLQEWPDNLQRLFRRIEEEDFSLNLKHEGLLGLEETLSSAANRLTLAIVIGSLIIGSSLIITTGVRPYLWGFPLIGLVGYLMSALLGLWVIADILHHGRHR
jgi:ubiquinone biosynthesis protein